MFKKLLVLVPLALSIGALQVHAGMLPVPSLSAMQHAEEKNIIARDEMLLTNRHRVPVVSDVFADNILLTLSYMSGRVANPAHVNWDEVKATQKHEIVLQPGEVFAFHEDAIAQYADKVTVTTNAHFNAVEGFRSSGYLYGDGVCHLASLFNRAGQKAGLKVTAPVNHDFAVIPDISREFGTAIYYSPGEKSVNEIQNLYIENTFDKTVKFEITSNKEKVEVQVVLEK